MKPARFDYLDPTTLPEALDLLQQYGDDGKVLAGGQSLLPLLYMRLAAPPYLIDVNRVAGLADRARRGRHPLHRRPRPPARARARRAHSAGRPLISEALRLVGHVPIRNRGTFGGSVAHADPSAELPAIVAVLDGTLRVASAQGERTVAADDFFLTYLTTAVEPTSYWSRSSCPRPPPGSGWAFLEVSRRHGDFALVGAACLLTLEPDGRHVATARLAFTGVGGNAPARPRRRGRARRRDPRT